MSYVTDGAVTREFAQLMVALAEATNTKLTEGRVRVYAQDLSDIPWDQLTLACGQAMRATQFFPSIAEIRRQLGPSGDDAALIAWTALTQAVSLAGAYSSVEVEDGCAAEALEVVFGSWAGFCEIGDGPALAQKRQEYLAAYRNARRRSPPSRRLAGLCEVSGSYAAGALAPRVWVAAILASGRVVPHRDRPRLAPGDVPLPLMLDGDHEVEP